jgi:hypothetical protein
LPSRNLDPSPKVKCGSALEKRVMTDTEARDWTRWCLAGLAALAVAIGSPRPVPAAEPARARVLWAHADRVYVALAPGARAEQGDSARFEDRGKPVAGGHVSSVIHDEVAVVSLTSGSLERVKKLDRVRVSLSRPPVAARTSLRIALPSNDRDNLLFRCGEVVPRLPAEAPAYRTERVDGHLLRMTRDGPAAAGLWPDTLLVFLFYDPRDEEIALERGDVDVAVFWPGELSRRVREDARWHGFLLGARSRGILALEGAEGVAGAAPDSAEAAVFNDALFRGDLALLGVRGPGGGRPWGGIFWKIDVDRSLPGHDAIRGQIRKGVVTTSVPIPESPARLRYLDAPADTLPSSRFHPVFRVRCPVVCAVPLRPLVTALGADAFAEMPECRPAAAESRR